MRGKADRLLWKNNMRYHFAQQWNSLVGDEKLCSNYNTQRRSKKVKLLRKGYIAGKGWIGICLFKIGNFVHKYRNERLRFVKIMHIDLRVGEWLRIKTIVIQRMVSFYQKGN